MNPLLLALTVGLMLVSNDPVHAQAYPDRPVRYISPFPPGGVNDIVSRIMAAKLSEIWGRQVIVDNRPGAGGTIGADIAAKATPDGYTLLMGGIGTHGIAPALYKKLPYDHIKDFAPLSMIGTVPHVLVVHPSLPVKSVRELIAYAKANPGKINYGSSGVGTALHLSMEMFRSMTGIDIVHVPYKGGGPAQTDLLGGRILAMCATLTGELPHIKSGKVRALGVTSTKRSALLPDVPTIAESGVPGFEVTAWNAMFTQAAVPKPILAKLNADVVRALSLPDVQRRLAENGLDAAASTTEQLSAFVKSETVKWAKAVKDSGATAE